MCSHPAACDVLWDADLLPRCPEDVCGNPEAQKAMWDHLSAVRRGVERRCLLLHGPPGVGKTSAARVYLERAGFTEIVEANASDAMGRAEMDRFLSPPPAVTRFTEAGAPPKGGLRGILVDEADGLPPTAIAALCAALRRRPELVDARTAVVCVCDRVGDPKLRSLCSKAVSRCVRFELFTERDMLALANRVYRRRPEYLRKVPPSLLHAVLRRARGDARKFILELQWEYGHPGSRAREQALSRYGGGGGKDKGTDDVDDDPASTMLLLDGRDVGSVARALMRQRPPRLEHAEQIFATNPALSVAAIHEHCLLHLSSCHDDDNVEDAFRYAEVQARELSAGDVLRGRRMAEGDTMWTMTACCARLWPRSVGPPLGSARYPALLSQRDSAAPRVARAVGGRDVLDFYARPVCGALRGTTRKDVGESATTPLLARVAAWLHQSGVGSADAAHLAPTLRFGARFGTHHLDSSTNGVALLVERLQQLELRKDSGPATKKPKKNGGKRKRG